MDTRLDLENELSTRLQIANNSTQFPSNRKTELIQDGYLWAGTLFYWPQLLRSRYFSSKPSSQSSTPVLPLAYDYYDYPTDFLTGSISRLYIAGHKYEKKAFQDFLDYVDESRIGDTPPDPNKRIFTEYARQFFVYPGVTSAGDNDGLIWGNIQPPALELPTSKTIFSQWNTTGNEAIIKKGLSVAMERLDPAFASAQLNEAVQLLQVIWAKVASENQKMQRLQHPRFEVPNLFRGNNGISNTGNFNVDNIS